MIGKEIPAKARPTHADSSMLPIGSNVSSRSWARRAGVLYVIVAIFGGGAETVRRTMVVSGDATATAENISSSATVFRLAFAADLLQIACFLGVAVILYGLLRHVSERAALVMLTFNAVSVAIMGANALNHIGALMMAGSSELAGAFGAAADAQVLLFAEMHNQGFLIAQVFFGFWLFPIGYMLLKSGYAPKVLAVLVMVAGSAYAADVATSTLSPTMGEDLGPVFVVLTVIGEGSLALWLAVKGLNFGSRTVPASGSPEPISTR